MKVSFKTMEHYGVVIAMLAFAYLAYSDYSRDGDQMMLVASVALTVLAILSTYFYSFHKWEQGDE